MGLRNVENIYILQIFQHSKKRESCIIDQHINTPVDAYSILDDLSGIRSINIKRQPRASQLFNLPYDNCPGRNRRRR